MTETGARPKLGFLGVGWIGRHRMQAVLESGLADAIAIADSAPDAVEQALQLAPSAKVCSGLEDMLRLGLDGVVIATPSALHAEQAIAALERGVAVFCQKPLGRSAAEVARVVEAAQKADRLLGVDFSYRQTQGLAQIRELVQSGALGRIFFADLVFHNAYGPDKDWFYNRALSGGGCLMDLGVHLVDAALWVLGFPRVLSVSSHLFRHGKQFAEDGDAVEDFAQATLVLEGNVVVRIACSWRVQAGTDCEIGAVFYGRKGGAALRNVSGSFYDFVAERYHGTTVENLSVPPDEWGGRAAVQWAQALAQGARFDAEAHRFTRVAEVLDRIYAEAGIRAQESDIRTRWSSSGSDNLVRLTAG